ncbi:metal ABC transporter ATP-binding protein [Gleimia sp. 6138-11-ORH1]|uniref:metal ABC transporter ATP-binding protein n=1 Tax=Gleimia sp. 6138-11-ORH1 TaxID=2973937 RepID=UPI0021687F13|nr:metal ABC transporter ATP-binding protein [Gleimia sp. 6138-11-ORH1]MCS4484201.1 metal ABC transporter ATP-binding protein [Gleimia sp. 6138-11-ORH1]
MPVNALSVKHLSVRYGNHEVIHGMTFSVPAGQIVAITGANGSGKSTLLKAILNIIPSTGEVTVFGKTKPNWDWETLSYVPQRIAIQPGVQSTVLEVVCSGALTAGRLFFPRKVKEIANSKLAEVEMEHRLHSPFNQLSGGQQQRVLIARSLMRSPELLLMDEPLSGIDLKSAQNLAQLVGNLKAQGKTVIMVLHELGALEKVLDRVIRIKDGQIIADKTQWKPGELDD